MLPVAHGGVDAVVRPALKLPDLVDIDDDGLAAPEEIDRAQQLFQLQQRMFKLQYAGFRIGEGPALHTLQIQDFRRFYDNLYTVPDPQQPAALKLQKTYQLLHLRRWTRTAQDHFILSLGDVLYGIFHTAPFRPLCRHWSHCSNSSHKEQ